MRSNTVKEAKYRFEDTKIKVELVRVRGEYLNLRIKSEEMGASESMNFGDSFKNSSFSEIKKAIQEGFNTVESEVSRKSGIEDKVVKAIEELMEEKDSSRPWSL